MTVPHTVVDDTQVSEQARTSKEYSKFEADRAIDEPHEREAEIIADFIEKLEVTYVAGKIDGEYYSPYKHASLVRSQKRDGFNVHYAFPNGSDSPVASFWAVCGDDRFKFIHIDLGKVMKQFIKYYQRRGHMPPPPRNSRVAQ